MAYHQKKPMGHLHSVIQRPNIYEVPLILGSLIQQRMNSSLFISNLFEGQLLFVHKCKGPLLGKAKHNFNIEIRTKQLVYMASRNYRHLNMVGSLSVCIGCYAVQGKLWGIWWRVKIDPLSDIIEGLSLEIDGLNEESIMLGFTRVVNEASVFFWRTLIWKRHPDTW